MVTEERKKYTKEYRTKNRQRIKEQLHQWYLDNKEKHNSNCKRYWHKNKEELKKKYKEYAKNNRQKLRINEARYKTNFPWLSHLWNAKSHCKTEGHSYCKRGIKFLLTKGEIRCLWFRDCAYMLNRPSLDRIDPKGNYEIGNCRFIELSANQRRKQAKD